MTLLLDENLSHRMLPRLRELFPGSAHVRECGLQAAADGAIWDFAQAEGLTVVTRDADFVERSLLSGGPPKVVHVTAGNVSTASVLALFESHAADIAAFLNSKECFIYDLGETRPFP